MKMSISDVEKVANESGLKETRVISLLEVEITPGIKFSSEEISKLAKLVQQKDDAWWRDAMSVC